MTGQHGGAQAAAAHRGTRDSSARGAGPRSRRLGPVLARIVVALVALAGIYLVVANLSLTLWMRSLARDLGLTAQVASAHTLYPGYVHLEGLRLAGGHGAGWTVRLAEADLRVDLADLVRGEVHVTRLRGGGLEVALGGPPDELARAPEVLAGAAAPLARAALPPSGGPAETGDRPARALLVEDIEVGARAIGAGPFRLVGAMSARAARLAASPPRHATLEVDAGALDIVDGEIHREGRLLARAVHGRIDARLDPTGAGDAAVSPLEAGRGLDRPRASMQERLRADGGALSSRDGAFFHGSIAAEGEDAGVLLDLLGVTGALRWTLEFLEGRPFALSAALARSPVRIELDDVRFESGNIEARGAFQKDGDGRAGAFLVTAGQLSAGLSIAGGQAHVIPSPGEDWLARRLDAITGR
ncbi:uncharacterized protein SOCEGT47_074810 [Sorangium cellulosum]|uniref:AsmA-like C-terminal domain-containing protein n=1 Tax=Sorangium cellulosum TaxID=56 RepID=A0A4P2QC26_SORCE|nr:hypothetical protein [Sorangium cellulosum]AUX26911.1 uncharacterized protein SOCEGT47_074810 [Sorangium cellulosum]